MNDRQKKLFHAALSASPPLLTNDPVVNHAIEQHVDDAHYVYDERYMEEIVNAHRDGRPTLLLVNDGTFDDPGEPTEQKIKNIIMEALGEHLNELSGGKDANLTYETLEYSDKQVITLYLRKARITGFIVDVRTIP